MTIMPRCIIAFHLAIFLIVALVDLSQADDVGTTTEVTKLSSYEDNENYAEDEDDIDNGTEDENDERDGNNGDDDNEEEEKEEDEGQDYVDNRIDAKPTFVSPVEKFVKAIMRPFSWISQPSSANTNSEPQSDVGRFINDITKPIRQIVEPTGRAVRNGFGEVLNMIGDRFKAIYPGTEWCGAGNIAKNSGEVGLFKNTDKCCRAHDQCKMSLDAGSIDNGLQNNGIFTRSHCICDANFYYCLKEAGSLVATNIGVTYFNILRPQCFKEEYPAHCVRYGRTRLTNNKCLDYDYDYTQNKTWQWFDSPDFI